MAGCEPEMRVRPAVADDLDALVALEAEAFAADRIARRSFQRLIGRPSAGVLVGENGGQVVGCAVVLFRRMSRRARLYSLAVARSVRGRGCGSALLTRAEEACRNRGCAVLTLEVRADNLVAAGLYESRGFRLIGRTADYYADHEAALHYLKTLSPSPEHSEA